MNLSAEVFIAQLNKEIAGLDGLVIGHFDGRDQSGGLGAEGSHIGAQVGIVGGLVRAFASPSLPVAGEEENEAYRQGEDHHWDDLPLQPGEETVGRRGGSDGFRHVYFLQRSWNVIWGGYGAAGEDYARLGPLGVALYLLGIGWDCLVRAEDESLFPATAVHPSSRRAACREVHFGEVGMGQRVILDHGYYADKAHDAAPWLIRNEEHRVVGHYTTGGGVSWGGVMKDADKESMAEIVKERLGGEADS
ncbi:MAG: hypothetical protein WDO18_19900 [Acidobacteriota bacterium]